MSFDDDYQQERARNKGKRAGNVLEGMGVGLMELGSGSIPPVVCDMCLNLPGVVNGVSGIVTQPIKGAQQGGAEGFFKGVGKGLLGYEQSSYLKLTYIPVL